MHLKLFPSTCRDVSAPARKIIQPYTAVVHREEGGTWELTATMDAAELEEILQPTSLGGDFIDQAVIGALTPEGVQPFRVRYLERDGAVVTVKAPHVYFDGDGVLLRDSYIQETAQHTGRSLAYALQIVVTGVQEEYDVWEICELPYASLTTPGDCPTLNTYRIVRMSLTDALEEIASRWSCYIRPDGWNVSLTGTRGRNTGFVVRYGVNMIGATVSHDWSEVTTAILPQGEDEVLSSPVVLATQPYAAPHYRHFEYKTNVDRDAIEASIRQAHPDWTDEQVRNRTEIEYHNAVRNGLWPLASADINRLKKPAINYTVEGYVDANICMGDTVQCVDPRYGLDLTAACIAYDFNVVTERYDGIQFGDFKKSLRSLRPKS